MANYKNVDTEKLVNMWRYSINRKESDKMEKELENRGIELTAENIQKILFSE